MCVRVYPMIPSKNCTTQIFFVKREFANNWLHFIRHAFNGASSNHLSVSLSLCLSHSSSSLSPYSKFPYSPSCIPLPLTTPLFSPTPPPLPPSPSLSRLGFYNPLGAYVILGIHVLPLSLYVHRFSREIPYLDAYNGFVPLAIVLFLVPARILGMIAEVR